MSIEGGGGGQKFIGGRSVNRVFSGNVNVEGSVPTICENTTVNTANNAVLCCINMPAVYIKSAILRV